MTKARDVSSRGGLTQIIPTSVTVGSGSATVSANGTINFSGATNITMNGVFTPNFQNYKMMVNDTVSSQGETGIRFSTNGTVNTAAYYYIGGQYVVYSGSSVIGYAGNGSTGITIGIAHTTGNYNSSVVEIMNPNVAQTTQVSCFSAANSGYFYTGNGIYNQQTPYDGVNLFHWVGGATITGTVRLYGYNNG